MKASVACALDNLCQENEKRAQFNQRKMKDLQRVVLGKLPVLKNGENDPNLGRRILMLLLQSQKSAQLSPAETSDIDNFKIAVTLFRMHGLQTPANEFLLSLQLLRQI